MKEFCPCIIHVRVMSLFGKYFYIACTEIECLMFFSLNSIPHLLILWIFIYFFIILKRYSFFFLIKKAYLHNFTDWNYIKIQYTNKRKTTLEKKNGKNEMQFYTFWYWDIFFTSVEYSILTRVEHSRIKVKDNKFPKWLIDIHICYVGWKEVSISSIINEKVEIILKIVSSVTYS